MIFISTRYFVIIHHDKKYLGECFIKIRDLLWNDYKLELNKKSRIYDVYDGFDFLGYSFRVVDGKTLRRVSGRSLKNIRANIRCSDVDFNSFCTYMNYSNSYKYCDSRCICNYLDDYFGA